MLVRLIALSGLITLLLTGCQLSYRPTIEQGNRLSATQISAIHRGMTRAQVLAQLGQPVRINTFSPNQLVYAYSRQPNHAKRTGKWLVITFRGNRVVSVKSSRY